jgi:hypothetical protein
MNTIARNTVRDLIHLEDKTNSSSWVRAEELLAAFYAELVRDRVFCSATTQNNKRQSDSTS